MFGAIYGFSWPGRGPGPPISKLLLHALTILLLSLHISAEKNNYSSLITKLGTAKRQTYFSSSLLLSTLLFFSGFYVKDICSKTQFMQGIYRQSDGGVLISNNEHNLDCIMTFQTHTVLQRFMLRFEELNIDCNDHLYVFDGANAVGPYKAHLSCRNTTKDFGIMFTGTNFLTLKFVTDAFGVSNKHGFSLLMTAFKDQTVQKCYDFQCDFRNLCISMDLVCDGLDHCMDGSDEAIPKPCSITENTVLGYHATLLVPVLIILAVVLCLLITIIIACLRRSHRSTARHPSSYHNSTTNIPLENMHGANGTSCSVGIRGTTIVSGANASGSNKNLSKTLPGNLHHPAGLKLGYSEVRARLYYQAK